MWLCCTERSQTRDMPVEKLLQNLEKQSFSGKPIDLDLEDVDLETLFTDLGEVSGISFKLSPEIQIQSRKNWTYKCKQVPWDQVLAFILQEFDFDAVQKGEDVYLQPKTASGMKLIREEDLKRSGPSRVVLVLIILAVLAAAGGTAGFLFSKRAAKANAGI